MRSLLLALALSAAPASALPLRVAAARTGLSPVQLAAMRTHSRGIVDALPSVPENGYLLGLSGPAYEAAVRATGLTAYDEAYAEALGKLRDDANEPFMERLVASRSRIVFLVPPDVLSHPLANMTKKELEWLLAEPERMADVTFVVGDRPAAPMERPSDATRVAQRRRLAGGGLRLVEGRERLKAVEEFLSEMAAAPDVREKPAARKTFFQTAKGWYLLQRVRRGLFLELLGGDRRLAFVSRDGEPELHAELERRLAALY